MPLTDEGARVIARGRAPNLPMFERKFPPLDTKHFPAGNISTGTQESMGKGLALAFNCVNSKETDMYKVSDDMHEDFLSGNWLHDVPTVDLAF